MDTLSVSKDDRFAKIERLLYGWNYAVSLELYGPADVESSLQGVLRELVSSSTIISDIAPSTPERAREKIMDMVLYEGRIGHGPENLEHKRPEIVALLDDVLSEIGLSNADMICELEFTEGHPAYPVFWDFSYDIHANGQRWILVGSSSD